jgi:hypothetical protein
VQDPGLAFRATEAELRRVIADLHRFRRAPDAYQAMRALPRS